MLELELISLVKEAISKKSENTDIEFKAAKKGTPEKLYDTLSSFSNTNGGTIIFGIDERKGYVITGIENPDSLIKEVTEQSQQMEPQIRPVFTIASIDKKIVVSAEIAELPYFEKPCFYKGKGKAKGSYIRVGDADLPMNDYEIYNFEVYKRNIDEESRTVSGVTDQYINQNLLNAYIGKLLNGKPNLSNLSRKDLLVMNRLDVDNQPTLCSILNFGKCPQMVSPMLDIACTVPSTDNYGEQNKGDVRFNDSKRIEGTLIDQVRGAIAFVSANMKKKTIVNSNGERKDENEYPLLAIREAILNAVIHRDYSILTQNTSITITMYSDRIEIENPGCLYGGMTIEDLGKKNSSIRNPFIASILETMIETENRHFGIPTMYSEMSKAGLLPPLFENGRDFFKVTFYNKEAKDKFNSIVTDEKIINFCSLPRTKSEIAETFGFNPKRPTFFINTYVLPLIEKGLLAYTIPQKPKSKNQRIIKAVR